MKSYVREWRHKYNFWLVFRVERGCCAMSPEQPGETHVGNHSKSAFLFFFFLSPSITQIIYCRKDISTAITFNNFSVADMRLNFGNFYPAFPNTLKQNFCKWKDWVHAELLEKKRRGGGEEGGGYSKFPRHGEKIPFRKQLLHVWSPSSCVFSRPQTFRRIVHRVCVYFSCNKVNAPNYLKMPWWD